MDILRNLVLRIIKSYSMDTSHEKIFQAHMAPVIRKDFYKDIKINSILEPLRVNAEGRLGVPVESSRFYDDMMDEFVDSDEPEKVASEIMSFIQNKVKLSLSELREATRPYGKENSKVKDLYTQAGKVIYSMLQKFFFNTAYKWARDWNNSLRGLELPITEDTKEPSVPPEIEVEQEAKDLEEWESGILPKVYKHIEKMDDSDAQKAIYKMIVNRVFIGDDTLVNLSKETNISQSVLSEWKNYLKDEIGGLLGRMPKKIKKDEDSEESTQSLKIPKYWTVLDNKENSEDFDSYIKYKGSRGPGSGDTEKILDLAVKGVSPKKIVEELNVSKSKVDTVLYTYFNSQYRDWYMKHVDTLKKAMERIKLALYILADSKIVRRKYEDKPSETKPSDASPMYSDKAHIQMIENALNRHNLLVTVKFSSDYDYLDIAQDKIKKIKNEKGEEVYPDSNFKYLDYTVSLKQKRMFGKTERTVDYEYTHKVSPEGELVGNGESSLKVDGIKVKPDDAGKEKLDKYVESTVKVHGMMPHGRIKGVEAKFQVLYINVKKNNQETDGVESFVERYPEGIRVNDPAQVERLKYKEHIHQVRQVGPNVRRTKVEALHLLKELKKALAKEKSHSNPAHTKIMKIEQEIKEIEKYIKELEEKGESEVDLSEIEKIIEQEDLLTREIQAADFKFPSPQAKEVKDLISMMKSYGELYNPDSKRFREKPYPEGWLDPADVRVLAKTLAITAKNQFDKKIKEIEKQKGLKKEQRQTEIEHQKEVYKDFLDKAPGMFEALPDDLKTRLEMVKKENPDVYTSMAKNRDIEWVSDKSKIEKTLALVKQHLKEQKLDEGLPPEKSTKLIEESKFMELEGFIKKIKASFSIFADRLTKSDTSVQVKSPETIKKLQDQSKSLTDQLTNLRQDLSKFRVKEDTPAEKSEEVKKLTEKSQAIMTSVKDLDRILSEGKGESVEDAINHIVQGMERFLSSLEEDMSNIDKRIEEGRDSEQDEKDLKKYKSIRENLKEDIDRFKALAKSIELPEGSNWQDAFKEEVSNLTKEHEGLVKEIGKMREDSKGETAEKVKDLEENIKATSSELQDVQKSLSEKAKSPAEGAAKVLSKFADYFGQLYSTFSGFIYFRDLYTVQATEEVISSDPALNGLMENISNEAKAISRTSVRSRDEIKSHLARLKTMLNKFLDSLKEHKEASLDPDWMPYKKLGAEKVYKDLADLKDLLTKEEQEALKKQPPRSMELFPEDSIKKARGILGDIRKKKRDLADAGEKELDELINNITKSTESLSQEKLHSLAKKHNMSANQALVRFQRNEMELAKEALNVFVNKWMDIREEALSPRKKEEEKSPLGNRHHTEYDVMGNYVERNLPELFSMPAKDDEKEEKPTIPTPEAIVKRMEDTFELGDKSYQYIKSLIEKWGIGTPAKQFGMGGSDSGRSRPKAPKLPVPSLTVQRIKRDVINNLTKKEGGKGGAYLVKKTLAEGVVRMRAEAKALEKEGKGVDPGDVIDGLVALLKSLYWEIRKLKVGPGGHKLYVTPPGKKGKPPIMEPMFRGGPDIAVDTLKEGKDLYNEIEGAWDTIDHYIDPDKVIREFPTDLLRVIDELQNPKKAQENVLLDFPTRMSYNIASKFIDITNPDTLIEEYLLLR